MTCGPCDHKASGCGEFCCDGRLSAVTPLSCAVQVLQAFTNYRNRRCHWPKDKAQVINAHNQGKRGGQDSAVVWGVKGLVEQLLA